MTWAFVILAAFIPFFQGTVIAVLFMVLGTMVTGEDLRTGFAKGILVSLERRSSYACEKLLLICLIDAALVIEEILVACATTPLYEGGILAIHPTCGPFPWLLLFWLVAVAYSSLAMLAVFLTGNEVISIALSSILFSTAVEGSIAQNLSTMSALAGASDWTLSHGMGLLVDGNALAPMAIAQTAIPAILVLAVCTGLSSLAARRLEC